MKIPTNGFAASISSQVVGAELGALARLDGHPRARPVRPAGRRATDDDDAVYMVGPNLAAMEQRFGFDPTEFRTWVLLHELTHRAQFTGVPWMRGHFTDLVDEQRAPGQPRPSPDRRGDPRGVQRPRSSHVSRSATAACSD